MATIRKRGQKYQVLIRRSGFPSTAKTFHKRSDAKEWARYMETQADRGDLPVSASELSAYNLKDILVRYRDQISVQKRSYENEKIMLNAFKEVNKAKEEAKSKLLQDYMDYDPLEPNQKNIAILTTL